MPLKQDADGISDVALDPWSLATEGTQEHSTLNVQRFYDLLGRRVTTKPSQLPTLGKPGIYLVGHRKIIIK